MSDDDGVWIVAGIALLVVVWFDQHPEIIDAIHSVINITVFIINCILYAIGGIALLIIGYYSAQYIKERY